MLNPLKILAGRRKPSVDLKFQQVYRHFLLYLAALSTSGTSFQRLVGVVAEAREIFGELAEAFKRLELLTKKWRYARVKACQLI